MGKQVPKFGNIQIYLMDFQEALIYLFFIHILGRALGLVFSTPDWKFCTQVRLTLSGTGGGVFHPPKQKYCWGEKFYTIKIPPKSLTFPTLYMCIGWWRNFFEKSHIFGPPGLFRAILGQNWPFSVIFAENGSKIWAPGHFSVGFFAFFSLGTWSQLIWLELGMLKPPIFGVYDHFRRGGGKHPPPCHTGNLICRVQ